MVRIIQIIKFFCYVCTNNFKYKMNKTLKYIIRAIKYFFYFAILLTIILTILIMAHVVDGNIETLFRNGYKSLWDIAIMFACVAAIYPIFGFMKRTTIIPGEYGAIRDEVVKYMENRGYRLEKEDGENMTFRMRNILNRIFKMCEDRITFTRTLGGFEVEGLRKDTIRIIYGLENAFRHNDKTDNQ